MDRNDREGCLEALLTGEARRGSAAWERAWSDGRVREAALAAGRSAALAVDREGLWGRIEAGIAARERRRRVARWCRVAAAAAVVAGAGWWWSGREGTVAGERVAGERVAVLVTAGGQRLVVGGEKAGVVWSGDGVMAAVDSGRALSYKAGGEERRVEGEHALLVPRGGEYRLALEDGTRVALNAESRLRFPASFSGRATRRVVLEGEGYFEVAAMDGKPFVVESGCAEVTALGTSFNVNERGEGGRVEATVVEGSVRVAAANGAVEVVLRPGEQASAGADGIATREVDAGMVVGWTTGCFRFDGATLEVIAGQLERWYDARFCFAREELKGLRFTGAIRRGYSLEEAAGLLARTTRARVEVRGDSVVVE